MRRCFSNAACDPAIFYRYDPIVFQLLFGLNQIVEIQSIRIDEIIIQTVLQLVHRKQLNFIIDHKSQVGAIEKINFELFA